MEYEALGYLIWFTVHGTPDPLWFQLEEVHRQWAELGLDTKLLPEALIPVNAFRRASSTTRLSYVDENTGEDVELSVVRVKNNLALHERHVIRTARHKRAATSTKFIELKFFQPDRTERGRRRGSHRIKHLISNSAEWSEQDLAMAEKWLTTFNIEYERACAHIREDNLRTVIRKYLMASDGALLLDGVYFVPFHHHAIVSRLRSFVNSLGRGCSMEILDLIDTQEHRSTVQRARERS